MDQNLGMRPGDAVLYSFDDGVVRPATVVLNRAIVPSPWSQTLALNVQLLGTEDDTRASIDRQVTPGATQLFVDDVPYSSTPAPGCWHVRPA